MGLTDLFRPKYRHSDAAVRADAVRQMGADEADLVARIAREDRDATVRRIAIDRLENPAVLAEIAAKDQDAGLRDHARARASDLWVARASVADGLEAAHDPLGGLIRLGEQRALAEVAARAVHPSVRDVALSKISDARALADLARNANANPATRMAALERIKDGEVLRGIAVDEQRKDLALAALERIDALDTLEAIAVKAKSKAVRTRARKRLSELAPPADTAARPNDAAQPAEIPEDRRRHAERVQILKRLEALAQGSEWVQSAAEVAEIEKQWTELGPPEQADHAGRFESARTRYHARRKAFVRATAEKPARPRVENRPAAPAQPREAAPATDGPAAPERAPGATTSATPEGKTDAKTDAAPAAASEAAAAPAGATGDAATAGAAAEATPAPAGEAAPAKVEDEQARLAREAAEQERQNRRAQALATLEQILRDLERLGEATKRKQVERALERADKAFKELDLPGDEARAANERFQAARHAAFIKAQELREAEDWERWANVPRQEALIARAEALLAEPDDSKLGERLKALQNEWKSVGPVPQKKSRELWERFKAACDKVYDRVKGVRSKANEEMADNLARKEALCERVEALAESDDWEKTAEEIKHLQNEWKTIGPVPRKRSDAVWKRFRAACDRFFERRKPHLEEMLAELNQNLEKKLALCEQAEALAESTDWKETSLKLRDLQRDWRRIGPVPRKDANTVNKRFRAACDLFFERRDKQREAEREAQDRALDGLRAELRAIREGGPAVALPSAAPAGEGAGEAGEAQAEPAQPGTPAERLLHVRHLLRDLSLTRAQQDEFYRSINEGALHLLAESPEVFRGTELDPGSSRQRKQKLLARAEELAPAPQAKPAVSEELTPESMAERLRAALAQNALSSSLAGSTDARNIADTIAELESSWWRLGPVPGPEGEELEARFRAACERARQSVGQQGHRDHDDEDDE
jgi:hypothetical protein